MLVNAAGFGKSGTFSEIAEKETDSIRISIYSELHCAYPHNANDASLYEDREAVL